MTRTTKPQQQAIHRLWQRLNEDTRGTYRSYRADVQPTFGCDQAVVVRYAGMWVVIEVDGYAHS